MRGVLAKSLIRDYAVFGVGTASLVMSLWVVGHGPIHRATDAATVATSASPANELTVARTAAINQAKSDTVPYYSFQLQQSIPPPLM